MQSDFQDVCIARASQMEKPHIWQLLQLHLRDLSKDASNGRVYAYKYFDHYWCEPTREPLLFRLDGTVIGFALINGWSASGQITDKSMAEFFILHEYRRSGFGTYVAKEIIGQRKGQWEIPVLHNNRPAQFFWRSVVLSLNGHLTEVVAGNENRWSGPIFRFVIR